jgi:FixJ family two-component response regulator
MRSKLGATVAFRSKRTECAVADGVAIVVDDDDALGVVLKQLLESVGLKVLLYQTATELLESTLPDTTCCLVIETNLPEMSGLKLQEECAKAEVRIPIVFISRFASISTAVRAMKAGAVDFLTKPLNEQDLLNAVFAALAADRIRREKNETLSSLQERLTSLTAREREVIFRVASGRANKQIAADLGVSEVMVKVHRAHGMRKMNAKSVAELVRMSDLLQGDTTISSPSVCDVVTDHGGHYRAQRR